MIIMKIWCKHVRRLELQFFLNFCDAYLPVRYRDETPVFLISDMHVDTFSVLVYGHIKKPE